MRFHLRSAMATGLSVWLAVLACVMGCTLPNLASAASQKAASAYQSSPEQDPMDAMAGMENCPHHHFDRSAPAKPGGEKPARSGNMSCCPVEVTVAAKPDGAKLGMALPPAFASDSSADSIATWFYRAAEIVPSVWHSGRDTLLATHLLRI